MNLESEDLQEKVNLCVEKYEKAYGVFPNAVIFADPILKVFGKNEMLRNYGKERRDYSGIAMKTNQLIKIYMFGRLDKKDLEELCPEGSGKTKLYKKGGIYPLILATQNPWYRLKRVFKGRRFQNPLSCDVGIPINQLEKQLDNQLRKINSCS